MKTPLHLGFIQYLALLFALVVHESAHAWSASKMGDDTAKHLGRISLNPMAHIDIIGTVIFPILQIFTGFVFFGWAKPVPINPLNFQNRKSGIFWVSFAGPLSNLILGSIFLTLYLILAHFTSYHKVLDPIYLLIQFSVYINFILAFFNLIPIPPLDGSGVLLGFVSERTYENYVGKIGPYGFIILLVLMYTGVLTLILNPVITILQYIMR